MGNKKETHELTFSWLSWLAVLFVARTHNGDDDDGVAQDGGHSPNNGILDIHIMINWHLSTQVSADQYHVTISQAQFYSSLRSSVFWSWPLAKCLFFDWIAGSCLVNLGRIVRKPINANPGLTVNRIITFSSMQVSLLLCFVYMVSIGNHTVSSSIWN